MKEVAQELEIGSEVPRKRALKVPMASMSATGHSLPIRG